MEGRVQTPGLLRRMLRNIVWLLGGRGAAGVLSLAYLAIAARALGVHAFGSFSLVLAYGSSISALAQLQSGQAAIRFGAGHLAHGRVAQLGRLLGSLALLDLLSASLWAMIAASCAPLVAPFLGWSTPTAHAAAVFGFILVLSVGTTASGALRLLDRFDLLTLAEAVGPMVRLVGAAILWMEGATLGRFLAVWALAAFAEETAGWVALWSIRRSPLDFRFSALLGLSRENPGIGRFLLHNGASSSLTLVDQYAGTFALGHAVGAGVAGGFRIASKLAAAVGKPFAMVTRAFYPELARLVAGDHHPVIRSVVARMVGFSVVFGLLAVLVVLFTGQALLGGLYGPAFRFAFPFLLLLTVATAFDLVGSALEPVLNAHGLAGRMLMSQAIGAAGQVGALFVLLPRLGAVGGGWAAIIGAILSRGLMAVWVVRALRRRAVAA